MRTSWTVGIYLIKGLIAVNLKHCFPQASTDANISSKEVGWLVVLDSTALRLVGWLFGFNGPLRQYFSLYRPSPKEREKEERTVGWLILGLTTL